MAEPPTIPLAVPITAPVVNAPADLGISAPARQPALARGGAAHNIPPPTPVKEDPIPPAPPPGITGAPAESPVPGWVKDVEPTYAPEAHAKGGVVGDTKPRYVGVIHKHG